VTDFITNPRKTLRLALRCAVRVEADGAGCDGYTEDLGGSGCRVVLPTRLGDASHLRVHLSAAVAPDHLAVGATVRWGEACPPWRHGLAFDAADRPRAEDWFDEIALHHSELLHEVRVPDRLRLAARLYVTPAPPAPPRLGDEETVVLQLACGQPTVAQLQRVLGPDWSRAQRALFALLGRGTITLDQLEAGDPQGWRDHLDAGRRGGRPRS
jgi:hypothetical protein